jgi:hypothetical protein
MGLDSLRQLDQHHLLAQQELRGPEARQEEPKQEVLQGQAEEPKLRELVQVPQEQRPLVFPSHQTEVGCHWIGRSANK